MLANAPRPTPGSDAPDASCCDGVASFSCLDQAPVNCDKPDRQIRGCVNKQIISAKLYLLLFRHHTRAFVRGFKNAKPTILNRGGLQAEQLVRRMSFQSLCDFLDKHGRVHTEAGDGVGVWFR